MRTLLTLLFVRVPSWWRRSRLREDFVSAQWMRDRQRSRVI